MVEKQGNKAAGEKQGRKPWTLREFGGKTLWDWLQLLIVPVVLSLITVAFAWQQDIRQDQIENQRAKAEREVGKQRAQDEALQAYLNQMGSLLLEKDLRESKEDSEERTLARARTLTVLGRLDPSRKTAVMEFLVEAELVQRVEGRGPIIRLGSADLRGANLSDPDEISLGCGLSCYYPRQVANLRGADLAFTNPTNAQLYRADLGDANLHGANLGDADLRGAFLEDANLSNANLGDANLNGAWLKNADLLNANLRDADLHGADPDPDPGTLANLRGAKLSAFFDSQANLSGANLSDLNLSDANLSHANLSGANLSGANLRDADLSGADLSEADISRLGLSSKADLSGADLSGADLSEADLSEADLSEADLSSADLSEADLSYADLSHAKGMSNEELEQETSLLGRATMPDGQRHKSVTTEFVTTEFEPAFSISLSEEWEIGAPDPLFRHEPLGSSYEQERSDSISIYGPEEGALAFTRPSHVFDPPSSPSESTKVSAPETAKEWLSWFQRHPNLETSKPVPVNVGGASGMQIDVTTSSTVPLYPWSGGSPIYVQPSDGGLKDRFVIVDVGGQTVIINIFAPAGKFDAFSPKAQKILDTVEWKGG